jgi:carboxyl-terminal processing protease
MTTGPACSIPQRLPGPAAALAPATDDTMRRRVLSSRGGAWLAVWAALLVAPAVAQQGTTISISSSPRPAELSDVLRRGQQLESERRWGEALTHYEDALRQYPRQSSLQQRFESARLHYDLGRRYADRSFCESLSQLPSAKALDLYAQVLLKIHSHYVEPPNWKELVEHGTSEFEVALSEPVFVERNPPRGDRDAVDEFCRELRSVLLSRAVSSRDDARDAAAVAAQLAQQRLHISPTAVVLEYLCGATSALDPYSTYLTADQLSEVYAQIEGNFVGLGVELKAQDGALQIVRVIAGSPAEVCGIRPGDQILSVEGRSTRDFSTDQAANLLQGAEGTSVRLTVARPPQPPRQLTVRRQRIDVPSIDQAEILDAQRGIAYLRLVCFQKTTARDLDAALWKLHREGMRSLIIDLRGNPGGLLVAAVDVADRFLQRGIIVSTRGRSVQEDFTYAAHGERMWRLPLVVLIDQNSASAAEIFAGAIRDHRRGTIVGARSYGKGSVQGIFPLEIAHAGLRLTTAKFYSPSGRPYNNLGVEPDVVVQLAARPIDGQLPSASSKDDTALAAAVQAARNSAEQR